MTKSDKSEMRILIADDAAEVRNNLHTLLASQPWIEIVGLARDGGEALELILKLRPQAVVLDFQMPKLNGLEVLAAVREKGYSCVVLMLTNHDEPELRARCLAAGANFFLSKFGDFDRIPEVLRPFHDSSGGSSVCLPQ